MPRTPMPLAAALVSLVATLAVPAIPAGATIVFGQVDDFENGQLQDWSAGLRNPSPPTNIASGGPAGVDDNYLRVASNGSFGAGGKLVVFNEAQWQGDYPAAGVSEIRMQVNNLGTTDLVLRLILEDTPGHSLTTLSPVKVAAGSGWETVSFSLATTNLTNAPLYDAVMGQVHTLTLVHSADVIAGRQSAPNIAAQLGINNITAVPEPSTPLLTAIGFAAVMCGAFRKSRRPV